MVARHRSAVYPPAVGRRIFVGDVQGCRVELERLLEEVRFDAARDELHPVGDLVNRGPDSLGTLRLARELGAGGVLGNHDLHLLQVRAGVRALRRGDTLDELLADDDADELCAWLAERPFVRAWDDVLLVHAGVDPRWDDPVRALSGLDPLDPGAKGAFAVRVRGCDAEGRRPDGDPSEVRSPYRPWWRWYDPARHGGRTVVFGHWAMQGLVVEPGVRGLDTGCVWGGKLTAWIAEEDRIVQVPAERAYATVGS